MKNILLLSIAATSFALGQGNGVNSKGQGISDIPAFRTALTLGTGNSPTFTGINLSGQTASTIVGFDASKNVISLSTATYPSLTELSYVKGSTSALQTQLNGKVSLTGNESINGFKTFLQASTFNGGIRVGEIGGSAGFVQFNDDADVYNLTLTIPTLASSKTITLPDATGTVALTSDLAPYAPLDSPNFTGTSTFESGSAASPIALNILASTHAISRRASFTMDNWQILQDVTATGVKDFSFYDIAGTKTPILLNPSVGSVTFNYGAASGLIDQAGGNLILEGSNSADSAVFKIRRKDIPARYIEFTPSNYDTEVFTKIAFGGGTRQDFTGGGVYNFDGNLKTSGSLTFAGNSGTWNGSTFAGTQSFSGTVGVTGNLTVDTNTLFADSTNNRVGVGTVSPNADLHVVNAASSLLTVESTATDYVGVRFKNATQSWLYQIDAASNGFRTVNETTGTVPHFLDTSGYMWMSGLRVKGTDAANTLYQSNANDLSISSLNDSYAVNLGNASSLPMLTAIADKVGILNTSPSEALDVTGNIKASGKIASTKIDSTLAAAATTLAITNNFVKVTGDVGANTLATITGGISGQTLTLLFVDALVTITDTDAATANTVDLSAAFTSSARDTLTLIYDGTKWIETSRSVN